MRNFFSTSFIFVFVSILNAQMMGGHWGDQSWDHEDRHHMDWPDSSEVIDLNGTVLIDSTFIMPHYFLDIDGDNQPNYQLGFGPYWYQPDEGALRPMNGDIITIQGWLQHDELNMVVVIELNGQPWRDLSGTPPWSGNWIHKNSEENQFVYCPTDSASWLRFASGSMMGGGHGGGMMFSDSLFCQFELVHPDSLPGFPNSTCFAGFHVNFIDEERNDMMGDGRHGMGFRQNIGHRFHFTDEMINELGLLNHDQVELRYFDADEGWTMHGASIYLPEENSVELNDAEIQTYYGLFATEVSTDIDPTRAQPDNFVLFQNYPNPFNPTTQIKINIQYSEQVELSIYDLLGKKVNTLVNNQIPSGLHTIIWNGTDGNGNKMSSGLYYYVLETTTEKSVRKMLLIK
jgi:hypothetical protein